MNLMTYRVGVSLPFIAAFSGLYLLYDNNYWVGRHFDFVLNAE